jgi:Transmembrane protein 43
MSDTGSSDITDSFTETTTRSWGARIWDSIEGVLFGLALVAGSGVLLFWNEGRAVQTERSLNEGAGLVVTVSPDRVDPANEGKLVHVTGEAWTSSPLNDAEFGVSAPGLRLVRTAEMYQWKEESRSETRKNMGGSEETVTTHSYTHTWSDSRIDSSRFKRPDGHANPQMRYHGRDVVAADATVGAYRPGELVLRLIAADDELPVDTALTASLRQRLGSAQVSDGRIYLGADPAAPRVGDMRISYRIAKTGPISIIGQQSGSGFSDYQTKAGDALLMATPGTVSAAAMFKAAQDENRILTWVVRLIGAILMWVGFALILRPLVVVADVVPLIGNVLGAGAGLVALLLTAVCAPVIIAVAWFWYRPLVSVVVLAIGLAVVLGLKGLTSRRAAAKVQPA